MTDSQCLSKIKKKLGFPFTVIEKEDIDILNDIIYDEALKMFSKFFPAETLIPRENCIKVSGYEALWEFPDSYKGKILTVKKVMDLNGDMDFKFYPPNSIRIFGSEEMSSSNHITIVAKTLHKQDLSTIQIIHESIFIEYCTILLAKELLVIKKEFNRIGTPIGDIELNTDVLQSYVDKEVEFVATNFTNSAKLSKRIPIVFNAPFAQN